MAITVSGKNYVQISSCNSAAAGGTWGGSPVVDSDNYKEGGASISDILKSNGNNDWTFTPTVAVDMSGIKHLRIWLLATQGGKIQTEVNDGIQIFISDGVTTGYWTVGGKDTYPGGWHNFVVDVSGDVDNGTKPVSMNAITSMGVRIVLVGTAKNADNTWVDNLCLCDGLVAYGDDGGGYFDLDDIFNADNTSLGIGIIRKIAGQYFAAGSFEVGDSGGSNACKFQPKSSVLVFEDRPVNSNLYNFTAVDNGTGTTEFILGSKSGTAGIEGCVIRVADIAQIAKYDIDGSTDADVDNFKLYGSTFLDADSVSFPSTAANVEVLNCNFESCGEILPDTAIVKYCNVVSANDRGLRISTESHNLSDSTFISCPSGIEITNSGTYTLSNVKFIGCAYDIENNSGGDVIIEATDGSDPTTYINTLGGSTTIDAAVTLTLTDLIANSEIRIYDEGTITELDGIENCGAEFEFTYNYAAGTYVDIVVLHIDYEYYRINSYLLASTPTSLPTAQRKDRWYENP